jgi:protoporphyrinogen oxidase
MPSLRMLHKVDWHHSCVHSHEVDIYEARPFMGGKVASYVDKDGNHIEVGHV